MDMIKREHTMHPTIFNFFLFDFDGLLVNTEPLHYQAYINALAKRGHSVNLSFSNFCELAHYNSSAWREALYAAIPDLEPNWAILYEEKKGAYLERSFRAKSS